MSAMVERVVLLNEDGTPCGTEDKSRVHGPRTPLHLAFSCHLYDGDGRILVTRRALTKATWPGVWTNSFCGHPFPGESLEDAVARRAREELGVAIDDLVLVLPDFRYLARDASGVVENEICPVFTATTTGTVVPVPSEVAEFEWVEPLALLDAVDAAPWALSPWLTLQLPLLYAAPIPEGSAVSLASPAVDGAVDGAVGATR